MISLTRHYCIDTAPIPSRVGICRVLPDELFSEVRKVSLRGGMDYIPCLRYLVQLHASSVSCRRLAKQEIERLLVEFENCCGYVEIRHLPAIMEAYAAAAGIVRNDSEIKRIADIVESRILKAFFQDGIKELCNDAFLIVGRRMLHSTMIETRHMQWYADTLAKWVNEISVSGSFSASGDVEAITRAILLVQEDLFMFTTDQSALKHRCADRYFVDTPSLISTPLLELHMRFAAALSHSGILPAASRRSFDKAALGELFVRPDANRFDKARLLL